MRFAVLLASVCSLAHALSNAEIQAVFPGQTTGLSGNSKVLPTYTLTVVTNATHGLFSLNATTQTPFQTGWLGLGFGTAMVNADFVVSWGNPNYGAAGSVNPTPFTISHRNSPNGESEPVLANKGTPSTNFYTIVPAISTTDPASKFFAISYIRLLDPGAAYTTTSTHKTVVRGVQPFIYSSCSIGPADTAEGAILTQHDQPHAPFTLDLSVPISFAAAPAASGSATSGAPAAAATGATTGSGVASSGVLGVVYTSRDMMLIAHGVFASLAFLILTPIAILIPRFFRNRKWFPYHAALQVTSWVFILIAFALGVKNVQGGHFFDNHTRLGLALFLLFTFQVLVGATAHRTQSGVSQGSAPRRFPTLTTPGKSIVRYFHIALGVGIPVLGWIQIQLGFDEWQLYTSAATYVPRSVRIIYGILIAGFTLAYVVGWALEARTGVVAGNGEMGESTTSEKKASQGF